MYKQKPSYKNKTKSFIKRPVVLVILGLIFIGLVTGGTLVYRHYQNQPDSITQRPLNTVNYDPPTDEEKQATEDFKEQQQNNNNNPQPPATTTDGKQIVTPIISYAGQYDASIEASGYVSGIIEENGTCTLTLKKDGKTITKTSAGVADAKTTRCTLFMFPAKELSAGSWQATLSYDSAKAKGTSEAVKLEVK